MFARPLMSPFWIKINKNDKITLCPVYHIKRCVEIRVDTTIKTELKIQFNKQDTIVYDKKENMITIIEVGITSQDNLQKVEVKKLHKYDLLANEIVLLHSAKVQIVPIVLTWNAITTKFYPKYCQKLKLPDKIKTYIQSVVLRATYQSMNIE
ncbi:uncharacterized protein LOC115232293 [Octopus sinensis]|uniref:Uncharacterized protein LOC115232293 n=1 Tax=Octopus sinensis TaxID=2607531 RepID=A0A6P7TZV1_9MOLL|nr:uncharacterized protein LOC115232293 [Octopus sinensis]